MQSLKKKRRIQIILITVIALIVAVSVIGYGLRDGISFFRSPSQVLEAPPSPDESFRIGGLVVEGSLESHDNGDISFEITDGGAVVPVTYAEKTLPDLFAEGQGMIGSGTYRDGVFYATEILAKHDEEYIPVEVQDALKEQGVYQPSNGG